MRGAGSWFSDLAHIDLFDFNPWVQRPPSIHPTIHGEREALQAYDSTVDYIVNSRVKGDLAEFGCGSGWTTMAFAKGLALRNCPKALHIFDSFEGLPLSERDADNPHVATGIWRKGTCSFGQTPDSIKKLIQQYIYPECIHIYPGWFSKTLQGFKPKDCLALVHIDCDLYSSAIDVLEFIFSRKLVSEGAVLLFDDWNCAAASPDHGERKAWREVEQKYKIKYSDWGSYAWSGHRLIVHGYEPS